MSRIEAPNAETPPMSGTSVKSTHSSIEASEPSAASERSYLSVLPARKVSLSQRVPVDYQVQHGDVSTRQSNAMRIVFDERYSPVFITTFEGRLDLDAVVWHDAITTKAITSAASAGRRVVHIVDARRVDVPNAQLRRHWATRIQQSVGTLESMLGNFVVIDSPLLRGALTAIDWLCHEGRRIEYFSTLTDALAIANLRLTAAGYAPTQLDAATYRTTPLEPQANKSATGTA